MGMWVRSARVIHQESEVIAHRRSETPSDNSVIPAKAGIQNMRQYYLYTPASKRNGTLYVGVTVLVYYGT